MKARSPRLNRNASTCSTTGSYHAAAPATPKAANIDAHAPRPCASLLPFPLAHTVKAAAHPLGSEAPAGAACLHEIKYDGYRMHARIDGPDIKLLTRTGLDWSHRYRRTVEALGDLKVRSAYLDGELCALNADGVPVFSRLQAAMDEGRTDQLIYHRGRAGDTSGRVASPTTRAACATCWPDSPGTTSRLEQQGRQLN